MTVVESVVRMSVVVNGNGAKPYSGTRPSRGTITIVNITIRIIIIYTLLALGVFTTESNNKNSHVFNFNF